MTLRAAAVQFFATPFASARNLQTAEGLVRQAAVEGAQLIVLPELFNTGYVYAPRLSTTAEPEDGPTTQWLAHLAKESGVLVGGSLLTEHGGQVFNTFVLAEPGGTLHRYHKQHPFIWEHCYCEPGREVGIFDTALGRIGILVGWDIAYRSAWEALRGQVGLVLSASALPRLHRAVLNFPEARKVYLADLLPEVLATHAEIDNWYASGLGRCAAYSGLPVVSAMLSGRFVTALPLPRLSFAVLAAQRAKYFSWVEQAPQATLRATFYGASTIFDRQGRSLASVIDESGWVSAVIDESSGKIPNALGQVDESADVLPHIPKAFVKLDTIIARLMAHHNKQNQS